MKIYNCNENHKNTIGKKVRALRKAEGLSQKDLAAQLQTEGFEFTDVTILRIEKGKRFVPDYEVVAIAKCFHVTTDYLLGVSEEESAHQ